MHQWIALVIVLCVGCTGYRSAPVQCTQRTYATDVLDSAPLAYYRMNETSISSGLSDSSGNGRTATVSAGGATSLSTGAISEAGNRSLHFAGADAFHATIPGLNVSSGQRFTVEAWVYFSPPPVIDAYIPFGVSPTYTMAFIHDSGTPTQYAGFNTGLGETWGVGPTLMTDRWIYMVAVFYVGVTSNSTLYLNGALQNFFASYGPAPQTAAPTTGLLEIGRFPGGTAFWTGHIDELAVYSGALSTSAIAQHYSTGISGPYSQCH